MSARPAGYYEQALWAYTDATSYAPGDTATFFVSSPTPDLTCTLLRVGGDEKQVHHQTGIRAGHHDIPEHAYRDGCAWPETFALTIAPDWPTGYYRAVLRAGELEAEHFFVVRSANPGADARHVLVLATNTDQAYNSWGGKNLYGDDASFIDSPDQLVHRPLQERVRMVGWSATGSDRNKVGEFAPRLLAALEGFAPAYLAGDAG